MNFQNLRLLACAVVIAASNCAITFGATIDELDATAFRSHFATEQVCKAEIDGVVGPAAKQLSRLSTIGEMRSWITDHPADTFSALALRVGQASIDAGEVDPRREKDQMAIASHILKELKSLPNFASTQCGPNVRDHIMEALFLGLGGENATVIRELRELGVTEESEQRWTILVSLMARKLSSEIY